MMAPVASGMNVTRNTLAIWVDPQVEKIGKDGSARFKTTVQNQGFETERVRVGGLSAPSRWMEPSNTTFDLSPHEVKSYSIIITPPKGMPEGAYPFEITCMRAGEVGDYVSAWGKVVIS